MTHRATRTQVTASEIEEGCKKPENVKEKEIAEKDEEERAEAAERKNKIKRKEARTSSSFNKVIELCAERNTSLYLLKVCVYESGSAKWKEKERNHVEYLDIK